MHLVIRVNDAAMAECLALTLKDSEHLVSFEEPEDDSRLAVDAEFLTMGMAETLGLSPSVEPFHVLINKTPEDAVWLPASFIITGITLDHEYHQHEELRLLLFHVRKAVINFNKSSQSKICSVGVHLNILNMHRLPIKVVSQLILDTFES